MESTHREEFHHVVPPLLLSDVDQGKVDYISELPGCILSYIQSMISMKDMMNTSVLSKRWCYLWHLRRNLKFDVENVFGSKEELIRKGCLVNEKDYEHLKYRSSDVCKDEFVKRVDQFVKNFKGIVIDSFMVELDLSHKQSNDIDDWIRFAISKGVQRINLLLYQEQGQIGTCYKFPFGLSFECNNSTLKHMHLQCCDFVCPPANFDSFPFKILRSLELEDSEVDVNLLTTLLSNCLLLEDLSLRFCELNSSSLKIASSSLCHLKLQHCEANNNEDLEFISLDCLKLTSFYCHMNPSPSFSMNTPVLKIIDHFDFLWSIRYAFAFFATVAKLEILNLCISYNCCSSCKVIHQSIQTLKNLKEFNLRVVAPKKRDFDIWWILDIVLQASPFLQKLSVMIEYPLFYANQRDIQDCIRFSHNKIKVIELDGCIGNWYEIEFVMNALKYIHKVERIVLTPYWKDELSPNKDWKCDPSWSLHGRKRILEKLQDKGIELDKLVLI